MLSDTPSFINIQTCLLSSTIPTSDPAYLTLHAFLRQSFNFQGSGPYMSITIDLLTSVAQLIAIIDPMGALPIIMNIPNIGRPDVFKRALRIIAIAVPSLLIFFAVLGPYVLMVFQINIADFRIAGGIVLLALGIDMLREGMPSTMGLSPEDYIFVPVVTPLLVGPGALTSVMLLSTYYGVLESVVSSLIASLVTYLVIRYGSLIMRLIGINMLKFIARFMSLIVVAWAVSLIIGGVKEAFPSIAALLVFVMQQP